MSWMGKLLGGGIGFVLGGPLGLVLGAVIGHRFDGGGGISFSGLEAKQSIYFVATFSMLGKLAKADGVVTQEEIDAIDRVMKNNLRLSGDARRLAVNIFNEAKDSATPFSDFVDQFYENFSDTPELLVSMVELLLFVAYADRRLQGEEEKLILIAVERFGLRRQYSQIRARFSGQPDDIENYYEILGCRLGDDPAEVKRKYRKLAMEYHPDRIHAKGLPEEFKAASQDKFKQIQHAYDVVSKDLTDRA